MTNLILSPPLAESHLKNLNAGSLNEHIPSNELFLSDPSPIIGYACH